MMHTFSIRAAVDPQALPRVIDQLARQWVTPIRMSVYQVDDDLLITIDVGDLSPEMAEIVAATLSRCPPVHNAELEPATTARPPLTLVNSR